MRRKIGVDKNKTPLYLSDAGYIYFGCTKININDKDFEQNKTKKMKKNESFRKTSK